VNTRRRFPAGENLVKHWEATGETGSCTLAVEGSKSPVVLEWELYENRDGSYMASYYGPQHLGVFSRRGTRLLVTEKYVNVGITNSGRHVRRFSRESRDGVCCTEIVRAHEAGQKLVLERDGGGHVLRAHQERDLTFHEIEIETFDCTATFDLEAGTVILERKRFRDASS
jgi:hypothetical protein